MNSLKTPELPDVEARGALESWAHDGGKVTPTPALPEERGARSGATMRTLLGVDSLRHSGAAIALLGRLRFAGNQVTLAHVGSIAAPPMMPMMPMMPMPLAYPYDDHQALQVAVERDGTRLLQEASDASVAAGLGLHLSLVNTTGSPAATLMELADEGHSDLVAIGSGGHGVLGSIFLGSVGRALAIGANESFLIARETPKGEEPKGNSPVSAVFATDHSSYSNKAFAQLLAMNPEGLEHITVVTTTEWEVERRMSELEGFDGEGPYPVTRAESALKRLGAKMVERIQSTGRTAEFRLVEGHPVEGLRKAMDDSGLDLLILGARGHGLIDRVLIGSLALHQVVAEPYSVLVVRLPEGD